MRYIDISLGKLRFILVSVMVFLNLHLFLDSSFLFTGAFQYIPLSNVFFLLTYFFIKKRTYYISSFFLIWLGHIALLYNNAFIYNYSQPIFLILLLYDTLYFRKAPHRPALISLAVIMAGCYFISAFSKLKAPIWFNGEAVEAIFSSAPMISPILKDFVLGNSFLKPILKIMTYGLVLLQFITPLVFIIKSRAFREMIWIQHTLFHLFTLIFMSIFPVSAAYLISQFYILKLITDKRD